MRTGLALWRAAIAAVLTVHTAPGWSQDAAERNDLDELRKFVHPEPPPMGDFCLTDETCLQFRGGGPILGSGLFIHHLRTEATELLVGGEIELLALRTVSSGEHVLLLKSGGYGLPDAPRGVAYTRIVALVIDRTDEPRVSDLTQVNWDMEDGGCAEGISEAGQIVSAEFSDTHASETPTILVSVALTTCANSQETRQHLRFTYDAGEFRK